MNSMVIDENLTRKGLFQNYSLEIEQKGALFLTCIGFIHGMLDCTLPALSTGAVDMNVKINIPSILFSLGSFYESMLV